MTVVRRWLCSYSSRALVPAVGSPRVVLPSWWSRWLPAFCVGRVSSPTGEGTLQVLALLPFFVLLLVLAVEGSFLRFFCLCSALVCGATWTSTISSWTMYLGRFAALSELRSARQVERFAVCSSGICRQ